MKVIETIEVGKEERTEESRNTTIDTSKDMPQTGARSDMPFLTFCLSSTIFFITLATWFKKRKGV